MVVSLVLEKYKPVLCYRAVAIVNIYRNYYCTSIVLLRLFHICKLAVLLKLLHSHEGDVHKGDKFLLSLLRISVHILSRLKVLIIGSLDRCLVEAIAKAYIFQLCSEGCVTAMIRPVCIKNADLSH